VRLLLIRVATEKALPFEIRVPNRESVAAIEDSRAKRVEDVTVDDLRAAFHEKA
jgi:DNA-damage-inducible protein J